MRHYDVACTVRICSSRVVVLTVYYGYYCTVRMYTGGGTSRVVVLAPYYSLLMVGKARTSAGLTQTY